VSLLAPCDRSYAREPSFYFVTRRQHHHHLPRKRETIWSLHIPARAPHVAAALRIMVDELLSFDRNCSAWTSPSQKSHFRRPFPFRLCCFLPFSCFSLRAFKICSGLFSSDRTFLSPAAAPLLRKAPNLPLRHLPPATIKRTVLTCGQ